MKGRSSGLLALFAFLAVQPPSCPAADVTFHSEVESPIIQFGAERLNRALKARGTQLAEASGEEAAITVSIDTLWETSPGVAPPTGSFRIERPGSGHSLAVIGACESGALYGLLALSDEVRTHGSLEGVRTSQHLPATEFRAIKFNLPYMSYRRAVSTELHWETCRDLDYWEAFLDMMAENRFNVLTLWSLHHFHYMVRPTNFPEACRFSDEEMAEWEEVWSGLFRMAKERGIETYLVNWNIFVPPEFAEAHNTAAYSVDWKFYGEGGTTKLIEKYTREVVTQVINEYPDLTGLGITLGERMGGMDADERRTWLDRTFFAGMQDADRKIKFLYRAPLSANKGSGGSTSEDNDRKTRRQIDEMDFINPPVYVSFKYNWSHSHSSPDLYIVHGGPLSDAYWDPLPTNHRVLWTMRNEDFHFLRWGQPDFIREHMATANNPDYVSGYIVGAEVYLPAFDYITAPGSHKTWQYAFERQWLFYSMWGRLLFDPDTPDAWFETELEERFGRGIGPDLLEAWKLASETPLHLACQYEGRNDHTLYCEAFATWEQKTSLIDIDKFIAHRPLDKRYMSVREFVREDPTVEPRSLYPPALADRLDQNADTALALVDKLRADGPLGPGLAAELSDIEAWCHLSRYFACKLRGGVALETYRETGNPAMQQAAVSHLEEASHHWSALAEAGHRYNLPEIPFRTYDRRPFSWTALQEEVDQDIETARTAKPRQE